MAVHHYPGADGYWGPDLHKRLSGVGGIGLKFLVDGAAALATSRYAGRALRSH